MVYRRGARIHHDLRLNHREQLDHKPGEPTSVATAVRGVLRHRSLPGGDSLRSHHLAILSSSPEKSAPTAWDPEIARAPNQRPPSRPGATAKPIPHMSPARVSVSRQHYKVSASDCIPQIIGARLAGTGRLRKTHVPSNPSEGSFGGLAIDSHNVGQEDASEKVFRHGRRCDVGIGRKP